MAVINRTIKGTGLTNDEIDSNFNTCADRFNTVASASPLVLTDEYNYFNVTGTTGISAITTRGTVDGAYGDIVCLVFADALTLTHNGTSFILPTGANITTAAGDVAFFGEESSGNWRCLAYMRADGSAINDSTDLAVSGDLSVGGNAHFGTPETVTSSTTPTVNWSNGNKQVINLADNISGTNAITFTPPDGAANLLLHINNTGAYTIADVSWPASVKWPSGVGPATITSSGDDMITFYYDGTTYWGTFVKDFQ